MEYPPRLDRDQSPRGLRPRLAMMAALLDDLALPRGFGSMFRGRSPGSGSGRGHGLTFPKWLLSDDDVLDDDLDRPVLRRSRSTWATWPSSSFDEDDDDVRGGGPWWTRKGDDGGLRALQWRSEPQRPRDQEELRAARRRYFERQSRPTTRTGEDRDADDVRQEQERRQRPSSWHSRHSPPRVSFASRTPPGSFRDVPIRDATNDRDAPVRGIPTRDIPVRREAPVRDIPVRREAPVRDIPVRREAPVRDIPVRREAPAREADRDTATRDASTRTREVPVAREVPVTRDSSSWDPPVRDVPVVLTDAPAREASSARDIPVCRPVPGQDNADNAFRRDPITPQQTESVSSPASARTRNIRIELPDAVPKDKTSPASSQPVEDTAKSAGGPEEIKIPPRATMATRKDGDEAEDSLVPMCLLEEEQRRRLQLQEENLRLKSVITTIQETNKRWQGFNSARQAYIQRLLNTIEEQQTQLNACLDALKTSSPRPPPPAPPTATSTAPGPSLGPSPATVEAEVRLRRLQREVAELQRRLQEAKKEHRDTVSMLQPQEERTESQRLVRGDDEASSRRSAERETESRQRQGLSTESALWELARKLVADSEEYPATDRASCSNCSRQPSNASSTEHRPPGTSSSQHFDRASPSPSHMASHSETLGKQAGDKPTRPCYYDVVMDGLSSPSARPSSSSPVPTKTERARTPSTQYSFDSDALLQQRRQSQLYHGRDVSPALSDALTPTPTPPPQAPRPAHAAHSARAANAGHAEDATSTSYPVEVSGSSSSLGSVSGPAPHVSVPSSRATTPDPDVSMCSDATIDCSPPSPVQNCTRDARDARGPMDPFRWIERGVGLRLF